MNKLWKSLLSIFIFLLFLIFLFVMIENQNVVVLPFRFASMFSYPWLSLPLSYFLFWGSAISSVLLVIALIGVWLVPDSKNTFVLEAKHGKLKIEKKAIENFVLEIVKNEAFIENPSVKVKLPKKEVKVTVLGKMRQVMNIPENQRRLIQRIEEELRILLGTKDNIAITVHLNDYSSSRKNTSQGRVE